MYGYYIIISIIIIIVIRCLFIIIIRIIVINMFMNIMIIMIIMNNYYSVIMLLFAAWVSAWRCAQTQDLVACAHSAKVPIYIYIYIYATPHLPTETIPAQIRRLRMSGSFPLDVRIPPLEYSDSA